MKFSLGKLTIADLNIEIDWQMILRFIEAVFRYIVIGYLIFSPSVGREQIKQPSEQMSEPIQVEQIQNEKREQISRKSASRATKKSSRKSANK
jgi:hypothetical protein